jgi:hypothetical protein
MDESKDEMNAGNAVRVGRIIMATFTSDEPCHDA